MWIHLVECCLFCISAYILELCSGTQLSYLKLFQSLGSCFQNLFDGIKFLINTKVSPTCVLQQMSHNWRDFCLAGVKQVLLLNMCEHHIHFLPILLSGSSLSLRSFPHMSAFISTQLITRDLPTAPQILFSVLLSPF